MSADQIILSHTPLRRLAGEYGDKNILVIGGDSCLDVAKSYGFQQTICPTEVIDLPLRTPLKINFNFLYLVP